MTVLLPVDDVQLYVPDGTADGHGWAHGPDTGQLPAWSGTGNLQLSGGLSDPRAADGGGHGPYAPAAGAAGVLYLPWDAPAADGHVALVRGLRLVLSEVRTVPDPTGSYAGCVVAVVTQARPPLDDDGDGGDEAEEDGDGDGAP